VDNISYLGTDGESHIAFRGDKITVAAEGVTHFDWVHDATPEAQHAVLAKAAADAEKAAKSPAPKPIAAEAKKA
jgi:hypothetical protein